MQIYDARIIWLLNTVLEDKYWSKAFRHTLHICRQAQANFSGPWENTST